jgi:hypothetical protein
MCFSRKQTMLLVLLIVALAVHAASLCVFVRHYAASSVFEFGHGFATVYWGGDREMRNSYIFNVGDWPLRDGTVFAGEDWPEGMRWEVYSDEWKRFPADAQQRDFLRALGYSLPQWRHDNGADSILIPLGSLIFIIEAGVLIFWLKSKRRDVGRKPMVRQTSA